MMTHVSLFTGIGGLDLAAEAAGFRTILQVERDPYALRVLERHWPDVPRLTDIAEVTADERWIYPTVISGGFPCQPFSQAGKRGGAEDDRYLWPQMLRVVRELSPTYVVAENVSGLLSLNDGAEFELVLSDLEREGYETLPFHYPAASVGAPHRRDRVFIVAHAGHGPQPKWSRDSRRQVRERTSKRSVVASIRENVPDSHRDRPQAGRLPVRPGRPHEGEAEPAGPREDGSDAGRERLEGRQPESTTHGSEVWNHAEWWATEPDVGRVAHGIPNRVDRLRSLGNAVVPQQAYPIFATIAALENRRSS